CSVVALEHGFGGRVVRGRCGDCALRGKLIARLGGDRCNLIGGDGELFQTFRSVIETLLAPGVERFTALPQCERIVEARGLILQRLNDLLEFALSFFECERLHRSPRLILFGVTHLLPPRQLLHAAYREPTKPARSHRCSHRPPREGCCRIARARWRTHAPARPWATAHAAARRQVHYANDTRPHARARL